MDKQQTFLWLVQTAIPTNGNNLASQPALADKYRHVFSFTGVMGLMDDALYASSKIPESMAAFDAALEFCGYCLENIRDLEEQANGGKTPELPGWFARG